MAVPGAELPTGSALDPAVGEEGGCDAGADAAADGRAGADADGAADADAATDGADAADCDTTGACVHCAAVEALVQALSTTAATASTTALRRLRPRRSMEASPSRGRGLGALGCAIVSLSLIHI